MANRDEMSFFKGGLKIQNQQYKPKVTVPKPGDLLSLTEEELDEIFKIKTLQGTKVAAEGNVMIGFTIPANSYQQINAAYLKLKLKYPQAKHIVCVYQIPGAESYYNNNYCDDSNTGIGRRVLDLMSRNGITSRALFIARYSDGTKLGSKRFPMYLDAAKNTIEAMKYNPLTQTSQEVKQQRNERPKYGDFRSSNRGRSGRGGRMKTYVPPSDTTLKRKLYPQQATPLEGNVNPWNLNTDRDNTEMNNSWDTTDPPLEDWQSATEANENLNSKG